MEKNKIYRYKDDIIRVVLIDGDNILIVDCKKKTMPTWKRKEDLQGYQVLSEQELREIVGYEYDCDIKNDIKKNEIAHSNYSMISPILAFIGDKNLRAKAIDYASSENGVSKQTIRKYVVLYLVYQDLEVLVPRPKHCPKVELTQDEKNMRWGLNKFFYNQDKNSLPNAYKRMLKEKYCDQNGNLYEEYPSFDQFKYFYKKTKKMQNYYISRDGLKNYQRNNRPCLGEGVREFAYAPGFGMVDATVADIWLVDDVGNLIGRPIITTCIDAFSGLCMGYSLGLEGGTYSLRTLLDNMIEDKVEHCRQRGILITKDEWPCECLPGRIISDRGSEYISDTFSQLVELGVIIENLAAWRPELKSMVEKFFDLLQEAYKPYLKNKGVIMDDYMERGTTDYRKQAILTIEDFEKIIIRCIVYYNSKRVVEDFPYSEEMIEAGVRPYANCFWSWGLNMLGANIINTSKDQLTLTLLPRAKGKFSRFGLKVNKLRYKNELFNERFLKGGDAIVAYNPDDVSFVWLFEQGKYTRFELVDVRFVDKSLSDVEDMQNKQRELVKNEKGEFLQAQIDLANHIETIATQAQVDKEIQVKNVIENRKSEKERLHRDFVREGDLDGK